MITFSSLAAMMAFGATMDHCRQQRIGGIAAVGFVISTVMCLTFLCVSVFYGLT